MNEIKKIKSKEKEKSKVRSGKREVHVSKDKIDYDKT